ncbi:polymerase/histidinol phosphatase-like protein [Trametes meyenii]|nr:polymerase/histidinol phosphatase-like protein [Trametes meyenii]
MPQSHHSHSGQFCRHAVGTLEDVVLEAIRQGFDTYGLTEHVPRYRTEDLYPEEVKDLPVDALKAQFEAFLVEAHRLKNEYAQQITIIVGLETEHITDIDMDALDTVLRTLGNHVEYIVGSVHHVNGFPIDFDHETFTKALKSFSKTSSDDHTSMEAFLCSYFDAQYALMRRFYPEVISHFDLCRLYNPSLRFSDYPAALERLQRNVHFAVEYGALFELNAAAFRKGWDSAYPGEDVTQIILQAGGRFALSDDSHGPLAVGLNYHRLWLYARQVGISELWALEPSSLPNFSGRPIARKPVPGFWDQHPFWKKRRVQEAVEIIE